MNPLFAFYQQLLTAMIASWRSAFGDPRMPFEIVQLPNFSALYASSVYGRKRVVHWPYVREAQRQVGGCCGCAYICAKIQLRHAAGATRSCWQGSSGSPTGGKEDRRWGSCHAFAVRVKAACVDAKLDTVCLAVSRWR